MSTINSNKPLDAIQHLRVIWRPGDAQKITRYVKFSLTAGVITINDSSDLDYKKITEELVITIYEAFINEDQEFKAWLQNNPAKPDNETVKKFFTPATKISSKAKVYSQNLALELNQAQLLNQYVNYYNESKRNSGETIPEEYKLASLVVQNLVATYVNGDSDFRDWLRDNSETSKELTTRDCFTVSG